MKVLRKLLSLVIVLALIGVGVTYALTPSVDIKKSEKLENIKSEKTINDLKEVLNWLVMESKLNCQLS